MSKVSDFQPDLGAATLEPSIRQLVNVYFKPHFNEERTKALTDDYCASIEWLVQSQVEHLVQRINVLEIQSNRLRDERDAANGKYDHLASRCDDIGLKVGAW